MTNKSGFTEKIIRYSGGLIKNTKQAEIAQIIFVGILLVLLIVTLVNNNAQKTKQPSADLIHAVQPIGPLP